MEILNSMWAYIELLCDCILVGQVINASLHSNAYLYLIFYSLLNALASLTISMSLAKISRFGNSDLLGLGMVN